MKDQVPFGVVPIFFRLRLGFFGNVTVLFGAHIPARLWQIFSISHRFNTKTMHAIHWWISGKQTMMSIDCLSELWMASLATWLVFVPSFDRLEGTVMASFAGIFFSASSGFVGNQCHRLLRLDRYIEFL
ncbi:hypothetical protein MA16_Dca010759 [Dendrobium catenatum]|uniref:Uncharacterized protein n=1 Tax=Dendrobium catenatum TaxID=906689 RepID=A0A2I0VKB4_9ASPA|nr:hypothetical protein MA16_Dca010759 [Dendrobium catenatum]